jgi:hypothetical protein
MRMQSSALQPAMIEHRVPTSTDGGGNDVGFALGQLADAVVEDTLNVSDRELLFEIIGDEAQLIVEGRRILERALKEAGCTSANVIPLRARFKARPSPVDPEGLIDRKKMVDPAFSALSFAKIRPHIFSYLFVMLSSIGIAAMVYQLFSLNRVASTAQLPEMVGAVKSNKRDTTLMLWPAFMVPRASSSYVTPVADFSYIQLPRTDTWLSMSGIFVQAMRFGNPPSGGSGKQGRPERISLNKQ